jgi:hypothetical protein
LPTDEVNTGTYQEMMASQKGQIGKIAPNDFGMLRHEKQPI